MATHLWLLMVQTVVLEKTLESPLDSKEIKPVNPKGYKPWILIGRTDAEVPILWPPDAKGQLIGKGSDAGKNWKWEEKGIKEDKMVGWHHWLDGQQFEQAPGVGDGQGSLACCSPWGRKELGHNWATELITLLPRCHSGKESSCQSGAAGDWDSISGSGRCSGVRNGNPLKYSCLENSMNKWAWWAIVHGVTKSRTKPTTHYLAYFLQCNHYSL